MDALSIKFANPNPDLAASVVNELANDLARYGYDIKYKTTQQLSGLACRPVGYGAETG